MKTLNPIRGAFTAAGKIGINGVVAAGLLLGSTAGAAVTLASPASAGDGPYGFCATDNGVEHCETIRVERRNPFGRIIMEKESYANGPGIHQHEWARYWDPPPDGQVALSFLPHWNGQGIDKAFDGGCIDHS